MEVMHRPLGMPSAMRLPVDKALAKAAWMCLVGDGSLGGVLGRGVMQRFFNVFFLLKGGLLVIIFIAKRCFFGG